MRVKPINEIIENNENYFNEFNEVNDSTKHKNRALVKKAEYVDYVADKLVKLYDAPQSRAFFCKCAWNLPENIIWTAVETSRKKWIKVPISWFITVCNRELKNRAVRK